MPKNQTTAARRARERQAATGENYTTALRTTTEPRPRYDHRAFSARGAGWTPILRRAEQELAHLWPGGPKPHWEEKFGDLCWKRIPMDAPAEARKVIGGAKVEAAATCQMCPSPGRKRVVWTYEHDGEFSRWLQPWVKTLCNACSHVLPHLRDDVEYLDLVDEYEEIRWLPVRGANG
ncbi:hypothetical protein ACIP98_21155 [Streptomyces sp. NPDC088354]|uniref:hypothetical protein n=1 Tax=Streptomyces sp. NPDC088354 TaxID=3365856 RepID=UPI00382B4B9D